MNHQRAYLTVGKSLIHFDIPHEHSEVVPGVKWGKIVAFPTVAYWLYTVLSKRLDNTNIQYKLGRSLHEEVGACLLGGHGIPAAVGLAAYEQLKSHGAFSGVAHSEEQLLEWLSQPIHLNGKDIKYRFAKQKATYLHHALKRLSEETPPTESGMALRNWLTEIKGIGLKTASWIARNWLDADDVAILDIHIYRAGLLGGFFDDNFTVEKDYLALEQRFIELAQAMEVRTSELDAVMWYEMQQSTSVKRLLEYREQLKNGLVDSGTVIRRVPKKRKADTEQLALI
ncbi:8-oxoguanine DNA glycosylase [Neptunicella marina]|uniref:8-oxoguanine DNA glycosylase n=1 Tax=Neptunicella marina TaxID=2125989 RepID=A0A8J6IV08_9ALTE|nr:8-oxoguanine DNA glycosylase [Neptunicella marina]MBC3766287.1 8-oxoguanine DNA glycosylase [Neptunicella marina]